MFLIFIFQHSEGKPQTIQMFETKQKLGVKIVDSSLGLSKVSRMVLSDVEHMISIEFHKRLMSTVHRVKQICKVPNGGKWILNEYFIFSEIF